MTKSADEPPSHPPSHPPSPSPRRDVETIERAYLHALHKWVAARRAHDDDTAETYWRALTAIEQTHPDVIAALEKKLLDTGGTNVIREH